MISRQKNTFKKKDFDERNNFRKRVREILGEMFPSLEFIEDDDLDIIRTGESKLGLTNLYSKFLLTSQTNFELKELMVEHFAELLEVSEIAERKENQTWDAVRQQLMPQLMPVEFIEKLSVVNYPFGDEICVGIVIDGEKSYSYVTQDDLNNWDVSEETLYQTAIENLTEKSFDLEMTFVPLPNGIVVVDTLDSFDAVRILVPHMVDFFKEKLGGAFYFGVPNREFLICWSKSDDNEFQRAIERQIALDFEERPYPLTKTIFEITEDMQFIQLPSKNDLTENKDNIRHN